MDKEFLHHPGTNLMVPLFIWRQTMIQKENTTHALYYHLVLKENELPAVKLDIGFLVLTEHRAPQNHSALCILSIPLHLQPNLNCPISFIPFHLKNDFYSYWTISKHCCCLRSPQAPASNPALIALTESRSESFPWSPSAWNDRDRKCLPAHLFSPAPG